MRLTIRAGPLSNIDRDGVGTGWPHSVSSTRIPNEDPTRRDPFLVRFVPPIGAQGLNMSLADIRWLYDRSDDLMSKNISTQYEASRRPDMAQRRQGIDALNRAAMAKAQSFRDLRLQGLKLLHGMKPIRQGLMRKGLGL